MPSMDSEDCSDLYVIGRFKEKNQKTDTHFRAQNGFGSFNWRMVWEFDIDEELDDATLYLQVWDKDYFSADDYICDGSISFKNLAIEVWQNDIPRKLNDKESFVVDLTKDQKSIGNVKITLEVVPFEKDNKVGLGRDAPNHSPWLPPPTGRFEWSANPWKLFTRCVGPKVRSKVCCFICVSLCVSILIAILPTVLGNLIANLISKI